MKDILLSKMNINSLPEGYTTFPLEALAPIKGGFQLSVTYYSVSKGGDCTKIATSKDCTLLGDAPSEVPSLPLGIPRILERTRRSGNESYDQYRLFK